MSKTKAVKGEVRELAAERFKKANAAILAEYRGLKVSDLTQLRIELRKVKGEFRIINNRIVRKAIDVDGLSQIEPLRKALKGPLGVVFAYGDVAASAKVVLEFAKTSELFKVTGGVMEGAAMSVAELEVLSKLPSKEVLLGQIIGTLIAPHKGIMGVLNGVTRNLVQVINAIKEKKAN
jgi:large subunit ribosomal protein L10